MPWTRVPIVVALLVLVPVVAAEEVLLTDGSKVVGRVVAIKKAGIEIETAMGKLTIPREKIVSITFPENQPRAEGESHPEGERPPTDHLLEGATYTNWTGGFTLAVPPGWKIAEDFLRQNPDAVAALTSGDGVAALAITQEMYERSLESYMGMLDAMWKSGFEGYETLSQSQLSIADRHATLITWSGKLKEPPHIRVSFFVAVIPEENRITKVTGWCAEPLFGEFKDDFERMAASYRPIAQ